jgi:hypothetical protein
VEVREEIAAASQRASAVADQLAQQLRRQQYDADLTTRLMQAIAADSSSIADNGERSAEQAAMALDSLSLAYGRNAKLANQQELQAAITQLFQQLEKPSAHNARSFAAQMQKVRALLPGGRKPPTPVASDGTQTPIGTTSVSDMVAPGEISVFE